MGDIRTKRIYSEGGNSYKWDTPKKNTQQAVPKQISTGNYVTKTQEVTSTDNTPTLNASSPSKTTSPQSVTDNASTATVENTIASGTANASNVQNVNLTGSTDAPAVPDQAAAVPDQAAANLQLNPSENTAFPGTGTGGYVSGVSFNLPVTLIGKDAHGIVRNYYNALPAGQSMSNEQMLNVVVQGFRAQNQSDGISMNLNEKQIGQIETMFNVKITDKTGYHFTPKTMSGGQNNHVVFNLGTPQFQPPATALTGDLNTNGIRTSVNRYLGQENKSTVSQMETQVLEGYRRSLPDTSTGAGGAASSSATIEGLGGKGAANAASLPARIEDANAAIQFCMNNNVVPNQNYNPNAPQTPANSEYIVSSQVPPRTTLLTIQIAAIEQKYNITFTDFNTGAAIDNDTKQQIQLTPLSQNATSGNNRGGLYTKQQVSP